MQKLHSSLEVQVDAIMGLMENDVTCPAHQSLNFINNGSHNWFVCNVCAFVVRALITGTVDVATQLQFLSITFNLRSRLDRGWAYRGNSSPVC